jgi:drug/metabolite transporter (DMT)-like permease
MPIGLLTGLGAALAWGCMDIASALASRVIGSLRVTAGVQLVGATILVVVAILTSTAIPSDSTALAYSALLGLIGAGAYFAYFTALRIGPIAVVSGMVAAYGGLTVVLSVVLRGETLTMLQASGAAVATCGVILTGIAFDGGWRSTRFASPGVIFAVAALILFAMMAITTDVAIEYADWLQVLLVSRIVNATLGVLLVAGVAVVAMRRRAVAAMDPDAVEALPGASIPVGRVLAMIALAGMLDVIGLASFAYGLAHAPTWLVGLASSFGPAVTILIAVAFLGERLKPIQWFGLSGVAIGMIAIAIP